MQKLHFWHAATSSEYIAEIVFQVHLVKFTEATRWNSTGFHRRLYDCRDLWSQRL